MVRLDDIKFTNPIDGLKVDDVMEEHDSNNEENDDEEYDDEDDGFGCRGPFDYDYDDEDDGAHADENTPIQKGTKRSRGRPQGKKIVSSDAQSTNIHVMQDFKVGEIVKSKAELILRPRV
ncbi:hypothetical protein LIER_30583 [Lithospermum erythrorhizon]|uniref:Uncharacterized protein n=1 Tax=Lithospermum erythrorhizon TaxID=34254 RepID=A0AAV3RN55_LITER